MTRLRRETAEQMRLAIAGFLAEQGVATLTLRRTDGSEARLGARETDLPGRLREVEVGELVVSDRSLLIRFEGARATIHTDDPALAEAARALRSA